MKKFTFKGVLDGFRSSVSQPAKLEQDVVENLRPDHFVVSKTFRHGFPYQPTAMAYDPIQRLLAVGTKSGSLRLLGRPGVDFHVKHEGDVAVLQIQFLVNEGALVSATSDDIIHLWNFRQKRPEVVHSLKFARERITQIHLPLQSKWLYVGTERGNIHVVNIEAFVLSGYIINWNKAIELSRKTHPGPVVHLSGNPIDTNKLLIGYESGQLVLWDLRNKAADWRYQSAEPLKSISWNFEGKQFMCSHTDGSLTTWNTRMTTPKPVSTMHPHSKVSKDGKPEPCKPIQKVEWKSSKTGEAFIIFSGGLTYDTAGRTPSITVIHGKTTTVLEMEHNVVDFISLCESPWESEIQDPYAIVVLLHNDLVVIDLLSEGYPCFENPYPMDLHESAVTSCLYLADCPGDLIPAVYSVGSRTQKRTGFSEKEWPINGGDWGTSPCSYTEVILTGHTDGSVKFWDASAVSLQHLYKVKSAKVFEKSRGRSMDGDDEPFAVHHISICPESRILCIAGAASHVIVFKFRKHEFGGEIPVLEIPIIYEVYDEPDFSPDYEYPPKPTLSSASAHGSYAGSMEGETKKPSLEYFVPLRVRTGSLKKPAGFQADLVCLTPWVNGEPPGKITSLALNSSYGLMAYGNEAGLVIVDTVQKTCLLNMGTPDLYGTADPYQRTPRSPKRNQNEGNNKEGEERCRSPTTDQLVLQLPTPPASILTPKSPGNGLENDHWDLDEAVAELQSHTLTEGETEWGGTVEVAQEAVEAQVNCDDVDKMESVRKHALKWKGLKLRQKLNKVDQRLRHTFSVPVTAGKQSSVFYEANSGNSGGANSGTHTSPEEHFLTPTSDSSITKSCDNLSQVETITNSTEKLASLDLENLNYESGDQTPVDDTDDRPERPTDLLLFDEEEEPVRPPRGIKKSQTQRSKRTSTVKSKWGILDLRGIGENQLHALHPHQQQHSGKLGYLVRKLNKLDSSFSRSRSSSMSSLENISSEAIQCLAFADSYTKKSDTITSPSLWVGTSLGSVLTISISLPPTSELRQTQAVIVAPSGTIFRVKGPILCLSFLDCGGNVLVQQAENWKDDSKEPKERSRTPTKTTSSSSNSTHASPTQTGASGSQDQPGFADPQSLVIVSEKQARVVSLPMQTCAFKQQLYDNAFAIKADVVALKGDNVCLACYCSNGHLSAYSLPSLRAVLDVEFLPLSDLSFQTAKQGIVDPMLAIWGQQMFVNEDTDQIARTFCFSNYGHGIYLSSPCEIQKFSISADFCTSLNEMLGDVFLPCDFPEPPKEGFFKGLFGGGVRSLDREELFGESSGRPSRSVAKHIPGPSANMELLAARSTGIAGDMARAKMAAVERGEKLGQLEERSERLMKDTDQFKDSAHQLMLKYKDKKWYQL